MIQLFLLSQSIHSSLQHMQPGIANASPLAFVVPANFTCIPSTNVAMVCPSPSTIALPSADSMRRNTPGLGGVAVPVEVDAAAAAVGAAESPMVASVVLFGSGCWQADNTKSAKKAMERKIRFNFIGLCIFGQVNDGHPIPNCLARLVEEYNKGRACAEVCCIAGSGRELILITFWGCLGLA